MRVFADWHARGWRVHCVWTENWKIFELFNIQKAALLAVGDLAGDQWFYMRGVGKLRMSEIDYLVEDLVDKNKIFTNGFLIDDPCEVFDDDDDAVKKFKNVGWRNVEASGCHDIDGWLFEICKINAFNVEDGLNIALGQFDFPVEEFGSVFDKITPKVAIDDRIAPRRQEKYLRNHHFIQSEYHSYILNHRPPFLKRYNR